MTTFPGYNAFVHWFFSEMFINMSHIVKVTFCWQSQTLDIVFFILVILYTCSFQPIFLFPLTLHDMCVCLMGPVVKIKCYPPCWMT